MINEKDVIKAGSPEELHEKFLKLNSKKMSEVLYMTLNNSEHVDERLVRIMKHYMFRILLREGADKI